MKISYNWLKDYLKTDISPDEMAVILTNTGLEVEGLEKFESIKGGLDGLVTGRVLTCSKHPNADKLSVTTVDIGVAESLHIVCGAPNVAEGQKVVVATVGTKLFSGNEEFEIKKAKIRGERSEGMICAEDEIGIGASHEGIIVLPEDVPVGLPASEYYKVETDYVFEIGLTPNRVDGASHFGVARDVAAFLNQTTPVKASLPQLPDYKAENNNLFIDVQIENTTDCKRYAGVTLSDIQVKPSPEWLQNRLKSIGLNPINNVVDATNYVLHETGQPLHAFDTAKIKGDKIIVKNLSDGTKFITLDEQERTLSAEDLIICNTQEGMALAGIFGGLDSGVTHETKNIFIESAYFNPVAVRKTAKRHMLNTDASFRFERGTDPDLIIYAMLRCAFLIKELAGGSFSSAIVDAYPEKIHPFSVDFSLTRMEKLIGKAIPEKRVEKILRSLDIEVGEKSGDNWQLSVPPYRVDVQREADVVEEVLRIYGYNNIEIPTHVNSTLSYLPKPDRERLSRTISNYLSSAGFAEIMCNSLTRGAYYRNLSVFPSRNTVEILNPLSNDLNVMRQTLIFGALESVIFNINRRNGDLKLYEIGNCYKLNEDKSSPQPLSRYAEDTRLTITVTGNREKESWALKNTPAGFFYLKRMVQNVFNKVGFSFDELVLEELENEIFSEGLEVKNEKGESFATLGAVSPQILAKFDIGQEVYTAEIKWDTLVERYNPEITFKPVSRYPEVRRDLSLLLDENISFKQLKDSAMKVDKRLLKQVDLFDVYRGKNLPSGKKSYALSFILQDENKTLTDKQIDKAMKNIARQLENSFKAEVRQ